MENFTDLKSLHNHLEKNATDYRYPNQIAKLFRELSDLKHEENNSDEAEKAQWEAAFFSLVIKNGKLNPMITGTFNDRTYKYLIERLDSTANPLLKACYSHILWCSPKKHAKYAKMAVESYLKLAKIYEAKDVAEPEEYYALEVFKAIKNGYSIACQIKYKADEIKSDVRKLIATFNFESRSSFALRSNLLKLMLKDKRRFSKKDFLGFENICWRMSKSSIESGNIHRAIDMLELGEKIDQKLGRKTHDWGKQIAESYETLLKRAEKGNNPASLFFCQSALENYKRIKDEEKIKELEKKYSELKKSMKLAELKIEIDPTERMERKERCRRTAERVVQNEPEEIIRFLMFDKSLLPQYKDVKRTAKEYSEEFVGLKIFSPVIIDQRGHSAQHFVNEDEKEYFGVLRQYKWQLQNKIYLINQIFLTAIRENKLATDILLVFLNKHSWLGKTISKKLPNNKIIKYNWLDLLAPALHEYFLQMNKIISANPPNYPNLVLSIDSLTLKMEGLFRDVCHFSGVTTFYMTKDSEGRSIEREKDIHAILYEETIKELFDENDLLFFKFLLVEKAGYNLRHKIAHSLMLFQEYTIDYIHLLILALLRLGKYDFVLLSDQPTCQRAKDQIGGLGPPS